MSEILETIDLTRTSPVPMERRSRQRRHATDPGGPSTRKRRILDTQDLDASIVEVTSENTAPLADRPVNKSKQPSEKVEEKEWPCCPICLEDLKDNRHPMATPCGHIYCNKCLEDSIKSKKICPVCRKKVAPSKCIKLHFQ